MKTNSIATLIGASAIALFVTACDSKKETVREEALEQKADNLETHADAVRDQGEKVADIKESQADAIRSSSEKAADATENSADATRKATEDHADAVEEKADEVREQQ